MRGRTCRRRPTGPTRSGGSGRSRSRPCASFRPLDRPELLSGATVATDMFTPTTVEHVHGPLPGSHLRLPGQEPRRPDRPFEPVPLRHGPGNARNRGLDAQRDHHGQPAHPQALGKAPVLPETSCRRPGPSSSIAPPWLTTGSRESPTSMTSSSSEAAWAALRARTCSPRRATACCSSSTTTSTGGWPPGSPARAATSSTSRSTASRSA